MSLATFSATPRCLRGPDERPSRLPFPSLALAPRREKTALEHHVFVMAEPAPSMSLCLNFREEEEEDEEKRKKEKDEDEDMHDAEE